MRRIASHYALIDNRLERGVVVTVDDSGLITAIERHAAIDSLAGVEFYPGVLIPGMVNAHCHLELSYLRGAIAEDTGFAGFARAIGQVRGGYSDQERIRAAKVADAQMWEEGVEAVADIANDDLVMGVKNTSRIYYHTMFEHFGLNNRDTAPLQRLAATYPHCSVTPHSTYSLSDDSFRAIASEGTAPLSIHFMESDAESALYDCAGSLWEWYERMGWACDFLHYATPARRLVASVPAERQLLLIHATRVTPLDVATVNDHFATRPVWVMCPESNRFISRLVPPVAMLRSMGCSMAIGTDSLASARSLSMIDNMRQMEGVPLAELLTMATLNGARALGLERHIGTIEVGKRPGLVVVQDVDLQALRLTPESHARRIV